MASIYKRARDLAKPQSAWTIDYTDETGRRRTRKGVADRVETEQLAARLEGEVSRHRSAEREGSFTTMRQAEPAAEPASDEGAQSMSGLSGAWRFEIVVTRITLTLQSVEVHRSEN
jgi:hypothetical protein